MKIAAAATILATLPIALPAFAYSEADLLRKSQFCETATRLPWGDADQYAWDDCIALQGQLRSQEEYLKDMGDPNPEWMADLNASSLWARQEGCLSWAATQPENQPNHQVSGRSVWTHNDAWNACMRREGNLHVDQQALSVLCWHRTDAWSHVGLGWAAVLAT